jgi:hypothetical protein
MKFSTGYFTSGGTYFLSKSEFHPVRITIFDVQIVDLLIISFDESFGKIRNSTKFAFFNYFSEK